MTCAELITLLSSQPPDRTVLVDGYESGYDDINSTKELEVAEAVGDWVAAFDEAYVEADELPNAPSRRVIVLSRHGKRRRG